MTKDLLIGRLDFHPHAAAGSAAAGAFGGNVDVAVGTLLHVADTHAKGNEQSLATLGLCPLCGSNTNQLIGRQRADEQVVLPAWELVAGVEDDARRADRGHPEHARVVHAWLRERLIGYERPGVVASHRDDGPSIVVSRGEDVDLVATHRPDLRLPQLTGFRIDGKAVSVAMAVGVDLRLGPRLPDERIVRWHRA